MASMSAAKGVPEGALEHLARRFSVITERMELELNVAGTSDAGLERSVFKGTKNNTKPPKPKHVDSEGF